MAAQAPFTGPHHVGVVATQQGPDSPWRALKQACRDVDLLAEVSARAGPLDAELPLAPALQIAVDVHPEGPAGLVLHGAVQDQVERVGKQATDPNPAGVGVDAVDLADLRPP